MRHIRILVSKVVNLLYQFQHALVRILRCQSGQLDRAKHKLLHFWCVVLRHLLSNYLLYSLFYILVLNVEVVKVQSLLIHVFKMLCIVVMMMLVSAIAMFAHSFSNF